MMGAAVLVPAALLVDLLIGDPKRLPHPVMLIGSCIGFLEAKWNKGRAKKAKGLLLVLLVLSVVWLITAGIVWAAALLHPAAGWTAAVLLTASTVACRGMKEAAERTAVPLEEGRLEEARTALSHIVGRDTSRLDEAEVVRGAVETTAENTVDGVTAPLMFAAVGGAPAAMTYRALNTLDSMIGHPDERFNEFGWAAAKLDDAANWVPARLTFLLMLLPAALHPGWSAARAWRVVRRDARKHPSPNSGWVESAAAGMFGIQLGGVNWYRGRQSVRPHQGTPLYPLRPAWIHAAVQCMYAVSMLTALLAFLKGWLL
ncbi:adenosylcobinamide-phosphate synthase CbiB [Alkalicoccus chagannorensis]|uniref:adenosylcobinamide-phosphate synthase CbiB n=1 Tax=Alkalicoccus chagannorensis TaxID=427072 RepID=UPI0003F6E001|nr:adenosylcobinamide-phosphate synthase CbiB [Alkalicoccus chagannorensis]